jgi:hypothetical protein
MGVSIVSEIGMVRYNEDRVFCTLQEIVPMFQTSDNGEELSVVNWITLFRGGEGLQVIATGSKDGISFSICHSLVCLIVYRPGSELGHVYF